MRDARVDRDRIVQVHLGGRLMPEALLGALAAVTANNPLHKGFCRRDVDKPPRSVPLLPCASRLFQEMAGTYVL